jgi:hypothetical protein
MKSKKARKITTVIHTIIHFLATCVLYYIALFSPLWAVYLLIGLHQIHNRILGNCFFTRLAHHHGVMIGMSYWEYIAYLLKRKDYRVWGKYIDKVLKIIMIFILVTRSYLYILNHNSSIIQLVIH